MWMTALMVGLMGVSSPASAQDAPGEPALVPGEAPEEESAADPTAAFHDQLAAAKLAINAGDNARARAILESLSERLEAGEEPPSAIAREALVYLGDLRYISGEQSAARQAFRAVLLDAPDHVISPYHHTEDVRAFFALVREQVEAEIALRPDPVPDPVPQLQPQRVPPMPVWGYAPLGIPQLATGRTGRGILYGSSQVALAATSIGTYILTRRVNRPPGEDHPFNWSADEVQQRVPLLRYGVQWPATTLAYGVWMLSVLDSAISWGRDHPRIAPNTTVRVRRTGSSGGLPANPPSRPAFSAHVFVGPTGIWVAGSF